MEPGEEMGAPKDENVPDNVSEAPMAETSTEGDEQEQNGFEQIDLGSDTALKLAKQDMPETTPIEGEGADDDGAIEEGEEEDVSYEEEGVEEVGEGKSRANEKHEEEGKLQYKKHQKDKEHKQHVKERNDSIILSKARISYEKKPRHEESGFFQLPGDKVSVYNLQSKKSKYYYYMKEIAEEEEEEEKAPSIVLEEEVPKIDRTPYYARHKILEPINKLLKIRNGALQKKLAIFFRRRKMGQVLRETTNIYDSAQRYHRTLESLAEMIEIDKTQRASANIELADMTAKRDEKKTQLAKMFQEMQKREKDIGTGLIYSKTGNVIPDKLVERLIRRQQFQMDTVSEMKLKYIILREMVTEKQQAIADLDHIGEGLHLVDYEQLKSENRNLADKIEVKEEELTRLRVKCQNTTQILAHMREKSAALDIDIDDLNDGLHFHNMLHFQARERLNDLKQQRDHVRQTINKLRNESGLLTEPILLRDMENSIEELRLTSKQLEDLKQEFNLKTQQLRHIRRNIEMFSDESYRRRHRSDKRSIMVKPLTSHSTLYKSRASIMAPKLSEHIFKPSFLDVRRSMKNEQFENI